MKQKDVLDPNLEVTPIAEDGGCAFYDVRKDPFRVYGLYRYREEPEFRRMPDDVAASVSRGVRQLARYTAGGRLRFSTDSDVILLRASLTEIYRSFDFSALGCGGFDLYLDNPETGESAFRRVFRFPENTDGNYTSEIKFPSRKLRYFTIHFPSYAAVKDLFIGIRKGAMLGEGLSYRLCDPIVYYGSSITQGALSSRPGNIYENVVCRRTNVDFLNLGFSGQAKAEPEMRNYLKGLPMSVFVSDYDHNAPNVEHLQNTHLALYLAIRETHPDLPYIMLSRPDPDCTDYEETSRRRDVVIDTYRYAREHGDRNVYYIDGESIFRGPYESQCLVDGTHPNDLGFALMADAVCAVLARIPMRTYVE